MGDLSEPVPKRMRALVKSSHSESYRLETIDVPDPVDDEVLIRVESVALCGSDLVLYEWTEAARGIASLPFVPGHEVAGVVVRVGPRATLPLGQRVGVENHLFCGNCYQCQHGRLDICQDMGQYGHGRKTWHGGCSQYSIISSKYCHPVRANISKDT